MAYTLPLEIYEAIKKAVKDERVAKEVAKSIEESLKVIEAKTKEQKVILKAELKDELRKELTTKEDLEIVRQELNGKLELVRQELRMYVKFITIFLIIGFTLFNPQFYKLIELFLNLFK